MPLSPNIAPQVTQRLRENAVQIAAALSQAFESPIEVDPLRIEPCDDKDASPEWNGPGLLVVLHVGDEAMLVLLAASSGLLPETLHGDDPANDAKLQTLAEELAKLLLPPEQAVTRSRARFVDHLTQAVTRGEVAAGAGAIHCLLRSGGKEAALRLVWPATSADTVFSEVDPGDEADKSDLGPQRKVALSDEDIADRLRNLPSYARSLLRISVPVSVHLASIKQPVSRVLNIGPGTIIQFEKNCEQPLTLCVGSQPLAEGEAVKVGEKFGIKLTQMILPGERFFSLGETK
jgi:flagellar motor switch/type III secretory pathway protein FliN